MIKKIKNDPVFGDICLCQCHMFGDKTMYFNGCHCCDIAEEKYIQENDNIDIHSLYTVTRRAMLEGKR
jgi:hypothetical protein